MQSHKTHSLNLFPFWCGFAHEIITAGYCSTNRTSIADRELPQLYILEATMWMSLLLLATARETADSAALFLMLDVPIVVINEGWVHKADAHFPVVFRILFIFLPPWNENPILRAKRNLQKMHVGRLSSWKRLFWECFKFYARRFTQAFTSTILLVTVWTIVSLIALEDTFEQLSKPFRNILLNSHPVFLRSKKCSDAHRVCWIHDTSFNHENHNRKDLSLPFKASK